MNTDKGLTTQQVEQRKAQGKVNVRRERASRSNRQIIQDNVFTYFNFLNVCLFILVALTGKLRNGAFMITIVCNTMIGIIQEIRSKRLLEKMAIMIETRVPVLRNGEWVEIPDCEIVEDDVIRLKSGDQIMADGMVLDGYLEVDESILTGESDRVSKYAGDEISAGTVVTGSSATVQVTRVGDRCTAASIIAEAKKEKRARSFLHESLEKMIRVISIVIIPFLVLLFFHHMFMLHLPWRQAILSTAAAIIGMIPEGLVVLTTVALAVSSIRLSKQKVLVQDLYSIESLARVDTICLDKTGTLTKGTMSVVDVIETGKTETSLQDVMRSFLYDTKAANPTQKALIRYYGTEEILKKTDDLPFSSERKYAAASFGHISYYLGAAGFLFPEGNPELEKKTAEYAQQGMRVIVLAKSRTTHVRDVPLPEDLTPVAVITLRDDLRDNVRQIMEYFTEQDVNVRVISGDDPLTVSRIARMAGVRDAQNYVDLSKTQETPQELVRQYTVFGRVTPKQKKLLVEALQKDGHTVAMTGDGVNDVPALKCADVSIAMASGTSAAKDSANAVLLDDDFARIPDIVNEGRRVINNISHASSMYLVKTMFSIFLSVYVLFMHEEYPFLPVHLTIISAFGVGIPTFLLQMEPSFRRVNRHFFKNAFRKALPSAIMVFLTAMITLWMERTGFMNRTDYTGLFVLLTSFIYIHTLIRVYRPLSTLRIAVATVMALCYLIVWLGFGNHLYVTLTTLDLLLTALAILPIQFTIYVIEKALTPLEKAGRRLYNVISRTHGNVQ
ncbi:MAG: HAD-IC family P-type ATPase [Bulleidia sp.]